MRPRPCDICKLSAKIGSVPITTAVASFSLFVYTTTKLLRLHSCIPSTDALVRTCCACNSFVVVGFGL